MELKGSPIIVSRIFALDLCLFFELGTSSKKKEILTFSSKSNRVKTVNEEMDSRGIVAKYVAMERPTNELISYGKVLYSTAYTSLALE